MSMIAFPFNYFTIGKPDIKHIGVQYHYKNLFAGAIYTYNEFCKGNTNAGFKPKTFP